jgi:hypothetical protein
MNHSIYDLIEENIASHGRHLMAVFGDETAMVHPFVYTIGNHTKGLPELLMIGSCDNAIGHILNNLSEQMISQGGAFSNGEIVHPFPGNEKVFGLKIIKANPEVKEIYTVQAGQALQTEDYAVLQVVAPGTNGKFPGEEGADDSWGAVPLYPVQ